METTLQVLIFLLNFFEWVEEDHCSLLSISECTHIICPLWLTITNFPMSMGTALAGISKDPTVVVVIFTETISIHVSAKLLWRQSVPGFCFQYITIFVGMNILVIKVVS